MASAYGTGQHIGQHGATARQGKTNKTTLYHGTH